MDGPFLNVAWYALVGALLAGYAVLDGFDLGVGALHLLARRDTERRVFLNAIGPFWDGNQVWLVTGGGALFAAFPDVYATVFSGFYTAFILLLFMLIFRGVSIHVRSLRPGPRWRTAWDVAFSGSSVLGSFIIGVAMGNLAWGVPVAADFSYRGNLLHQLHPYALLTGFTVVALFMMHGAIFLVMNVMVLLRCWCVFYFGAMKTRILQFFYDQFALLRHGLNRCLDQGWSSAHFKMIF